MRSLYSEISFLVKSIKILAIIKSQVVIRAECNVVENNEAKSVKIDISISLRFSRDDDFSTDI